MPFVLAVPDPSARQSGPPTRFETVATPTRVGPAVLQPARAPYMQPPAPQLPGRTPDHRPRLVPPEGWRPPPGGLPRVQRGLILLGLFATTTLGFARAPYLCLLLTAVLALAVRTVSWTTESARQRQHLRGRRRWYDGPLTVASSPWYLIVATGGTLMLVAWATFVAFVVGFAYLLFRGPLVPGVLAMGAVFATSVWWGPAARRLRVPTRRLMLATTRNPWLGWCGVLVAAAAAALCGYALFRSGVVWDPRPGPPWRSGTLLGDLARWV